RAYVIEQFICELTGAEAATVTNNNAAAVVLALNTIALGHEAIVSRGELVEIGGSFRIPDIMTRSGVKLREIGTTNRTHLRDYEAAIDEHVALVMKVHTSNYEIKGFTHEVPTQDLVGLAREKNVPLYFDLGSGNLIPLEPLGLPFEATVKQVLSEGIDLVSFSGDKLLGGPQAGFLAGKRALIDQIKRNPLHRAFRLDKMTLAALQATLQLYLTPERLTQTLPTLRDLTRSERDIRAVSNEMLPEFKVRLAPDFACVSEGLLSQIGSGALPTKQIPSWGVSITASEGKGEAQLALLAGALRALPIPIIGRITQGRLLLDFRMLQQEHLDDFRASLSSLKMP
ncbi:MAG: L-seryl-tRNA(Sec) selenium transferase, partial [Pseudomonadales bacterium]